MRAQSSLERVLFRGSWIYQLNCTASEPKDVITCRAPYGRPPSFVLFPLTRLASDPSQEEQAVHHSFGRHCHSLLRFERGDTSPAMAEVEDSRRASAASYDWSWKSWPQVDGHGRVQRLR